jgi:NADH dehydrogenase FAD-containing subunit
LVQPFYTSQHAKQTRRILNRLYEEQKVATAGGGIAAAAAAAASNSGIRIAVIGGGYGGVELAASVQRRLPKAHVRLLSRGPPMANTRAEPLVHTALKKLGVVIELCDVVALQEDYDVVVDENVVNRANTRNPPLLRRPKVYIQRNEWGNSDNVPILDEQPWDVVLWTAGSAPSDPVPSGCDGLQTSKTGRLSIDATLRCIRNNNVTEESPEPPRIWALGDCAEIVSTDDVQSAALPKTAQVAMQQADTVAANVLSQLLRDDGMAVEQTNPKIFSYQDLGSMLTLGGPNAAILAPRDDTTFGPIFAPLLETAGSVLGIADDVLATLGRTAIAEQLGLPTPDVLGLSLGNHGLGLNDAPKGTLAGTLSGAARRSLYAVRMPTNEQKVVSLISAALSTAATLLRESSDRDTKQ